MIIDNKEIAVDVIKQLMEKMGKEQEEENLTIVRDKLLSIDIPEINLINSERLLNCLEYEVFDCFNIVGIRYNDIKSDMEISCNLKSKDKDRIVNFLLNVNTVVKAFTDYKTEEVKPITIDLEEMRELLC